MTLHRVVALTIACGCMIGGFSSAAAAQTVAGSFGELTTVLKPGKTVVVTDDAGRTVAGKLRDLSTASLSLRIDGKEEVLPESKVRTITERRRMTGSFAKIGLLAGALAGTFMGLNADDCFGCPGPGATAMAGAIALGGIGAGIGAIVGSGHSRDRLVYRASPQQPVAFSLAPMVSTRGTGLRAVVTF